MFWGLTPALDLVKTYKTKEKPLPTKLNILIIGGTDLRHVLKTIARKYRHENVTLNFFLIDAAMEIVAKQLLLLNIALQPQAELGIIQKTRIFMEIYGNTIVRPLVAKYLATTAYELVKMITNYTYLNEIMPIASLDIKYKERDYLENVIKFWYSNDKFEINESWDHRMRKFLGIRYDSKLAAFDWDLHMRLKPIGGKQVCAPEYKNFRSNGVAFSWLESEVSKPNRSLACAVVPNGDRFAHYGYLGEMQTGPFVTYGLDCEDKEFLKTTNDQNKYRATDVTERNLRQIFHEIAFEKDYEHSTTNDYTLGPAKIQEDKIILDVKNETMIAHFQPKKCIPIKNVHIKFLSIAALPLMKNKEDYKNQFNIVYFASNYMKHFSQETVQHISGPNAMLIVENERFNLNLRDKQLHEGEQQLKKQLKGLDLVEIPYKVLEDNYFKFIINAE